jgi:hypothetical protein
LTESEQPDSSPKSLEKLTDWARYRGFKPRPGLHPFIHPSSYVGFFAGDFDAIMVNGENLAMRWKQDASMGICDTHKATFLSFHYGAVTTRLSGAWNAPRFD